MRHGLPCDALVEIFAPGNREPLAQGPSGAESPRAFALPAGSYTVRVTDPAS